MDRAYEGDKTRELCQSFGHKPVVPPKKNRINPWEYDHELYKQRNIIERLFRWLKAFRGVCTRYDKLDVIFLSFVQIACIFTWLKQCQQALGSKSGGRWGNEETRKQNYDIATILDENGYTVTHGGAGYNANNPHEEYLPGPNGKRKGSNYVDITAEKDGVHIRINIVDTYADGTPTKRELNAAKSIEEKTGGKIILIPKGTGAEIILKYI